MEHIAIITEDSTITPLENTTEVQDISLTHEGDLNANLLSPLTILQTPNISSTSDKDNDSWWSDTLLWYPLMTLSVPVVVTMPLFIGGYLVVSYDTLARGKLMERVRSVVFLFMMIVVFIVTIAMSLPVLTMMFYTGMLTILVLLGMLLPPFLGAFGVYWVVSSIVL